MGGGVSKGRSRPASANAAASDDRATQLGKVLVTSGVSRVVLIRHANAKPRDPEAAAVEAGTVLKPDTPFANAWTVGDLTRELTLKGEEQAAAARDTWYGALSVRAVISSEATRAIATKEIMTRGKFPQGAPGCLTLHTLHPARSGTPRCEKMFDKLGYGTLKTYYADATVEGCESQGKAIFREYMTKVRRSRTLAVRASAALPERTTADASLLASRTQGHGRASRAHQRREIELRRGRRHGRCLRPRGLPQRRGGGGG
jgi:hypothetical protein